MAYNASGDWHAFLYSGSSMIDLGALGGNSWASGINNSGQVVGAADNASGNYRAFLWKSGVMYDLNKFASDLTLFSMSEFGYVQLPAEFTTGSSIMPQKRNPDVCELMRAKYHVVLGEEFKVKSLISNLMFGYSRDLQLVKEPLVNAMEITKSSLSIAALLLEKTEFVKSKCEASLTPELYATEEAYKLVKEGMPFRDAYKKVGEKYRK